MAADDPDAEDDGLCIAASRVVALPDFFDLDEAWMQPARPRCWEFSLSIELPDDAAAGGPDAATSLFVLYDAENRWIEVFRTGSMISSLEIPGYTHHLASSSTRRPNTLSFKIYASATISGDGLYTRSFALSFEAHQWVVAFPRSQHDFDEDEREQFPPGLPPRIVFSARGGDGSDSMRVSRLELRAARGALLWRWQPWATQSLRELCAMAVARCALMMNGR